MQTHLTNFISWKRNSWRVICRGEAFVTKAYNTCLPQVSITVCWGGRGSKNFLFTVFERLWFFKTLASLLRPKLQTPRSAIAFWCLFWTEREKRLDLGPGSNAARSWPLTTSSISLLTEGSAWGAYKKLDIGRPECLPAFMSAWSDACIIIVWVLYFRGQQGRNFSGFLSSGWRHNKSLLPWMDQWSRWELWIESMWSS